MRKVFDVSSVKLALNLGSTSELLQLRHARHLAALRALPRAKRRILQRRLKRSLSAIALMLTVMQSPLWAAMIGVTADTPPSINADGKCSLLEAIANANGDSQSYIDCVAGSGIDRIVLPASSLQELTLEETIEVTSAIVLEGNLSVLTRQAGPNFQRVPTYLSVSDAGQFTLNKTTISGVRTRGSASIAIRNNGGTVTLNNSSIERIGLLAVFNTGGTVSLNDSTLSGNGYDDYYSTTPYNGGSIRNQGGSVTITNSSIVDNSAYFSCGNLVNTEGSTLEIRNSVVSGNSLVDDSSGGGICNGGTLSLIDSTVSNNSASVGGGIANLSTGTATILRSTISNNSAHIGYWYAGGGGIWNLGTLRVINSTISGNFSSYGGGIFSGFPGNDSATAVIAGSTVTNNRGDEAVGLHVTSGTLTLKRSIISGNPSRSGSVSPEMSTSYQGSIIGDNYNLVGHSGNSGSNVLLGPTDIVPTVGIDEIVLPLADNGGDAWTHALAIGSPALDAAPDNADCLTSDERRNPRPQGSSCDIGAFEGSAVMCQGLVTTMVGTVRRDKMYGTSGRDVIAGLEGNDSIVGLDGDDVICGGPGADRLYGSLGNDRLFGEGGNDQLFGHRGDDTLNGGGGSDICDGGSNGPGSDTATACETVRHVP